MLDTTPPVPPTFLLGFPGDQQATLDWGDNYESDILGYNVYMSFSPGGPYSKMNSDPVLAAEDHQWVQGGLNNGWRYYFVTAAVDMVSNESPKTTEVVVVPGP